MEDTSKLTVGLFETVEKGSKLDQVKLLQVYVSGNDGSGEISAKEFAAPGVLSTVGGTLISREAIHVEATRETNPGEEHTMEAMEQLLQLFTEQL